jgi:uncharacterized protein YyaL (SSP411 family)
MSQTSYNRLKNENSVYLKQHAHQEIHWWSWSKEALAEAKTRNKPLFISIGYATCHWCHVLSRESLDNTQVAEFLNQNFVAIKVDREEFPEVDHYYQAACQQFGGAGGWPLNVFATPEGKPYFIGTYFPAEARQGRPSFLQVVQEMNRAFGQDLDKVVEQAGQLHESVTKAVTFKDKINYPGHFPHPQAILAAIKEYQDKENFGYGEAPKFPHFSFYEWMTEQALDGVIGEDDLKFLIQTVEAMSFGGMHDHVRGGFHRYSTDARWMVPHFEKMLYDQAGLLKLLSKFSLITPSPLVYDCLMSTLDYLEKEMVSDSNHFFSAQDAESEHIEGLYFTFTEVEFDDAIISLGEEELVDRKEEIKQWFGITDKGNFHSALNVVHLEASKKNDFFKPENWAIVRKVRKALLTARSQRMPPITDNKGLSGHNYFLLTSLLDVVQYCRINPIRQRAMVLFRKVLEGSYQTFLGQSDNNALNHLIHSTTNRGAGTFEDFVFFAECMLRTYEMTGEEVFKNNFSESLKFIQKTFYRDGDYRLNQPAQPSPLSTDAQHWSADQRVPWFDSGLRSSAATLLGLFRRGAVLLDDPEWLDRFNLSKEDMAQFTLRNPYGCGEALRCLSYPNEAYRKLKIPKRWLGEEKFLNLTPYFMPRFVFSFTDNMEDEWEICRMGACELKGKGIEEFIKVLNPGQE